LYVPQDWITDPKHRAKAGIPESIDFRTNPQIALEQIRTTCANDLPRGVVLMDAGFGTDISLRDEIGALVSLGRRDSAADFGLGTAHSAAAAQGLVGSRPSTQAHSPRRGAPTGQRHGARARFARVELADHSLARRNCRTARIPLCAASGACGTSRLLVGRAAR
jgi:hypothetical protein